MTKKRIKTVVVAVVLASSPLAWAGFQFVGPPPVTQDNAESAASSIYVSPQRPFAGAAHPVEKAPDLQGYVPTFHKTSILAQEGAGIAWPCHGGGSAPLNKALYKLLPEGWSLYAKTGTLLNIPVWYACHSNPWTMVVRQVLRRSGYEGTLWWGYDTLTIRPRPMRPLPAIAGVKPSTTSFTPPVASKVTMPDPAASHTVSSPVGPAPKQITEPLKSASVKSDPVPVPMIAVSHARKVPPHVTPVAQAGGTTPMTVGPDGEVIQPSLEQKVIPLVRAIHGHWRLELPTHPNHREIALAKAWLSAGGTLFSPLPQQ